MKFNNLILNAGLQALTSHVSGTSVSKQRQSFIIPSNVYVTVIVYNMLKLSVTLASLCSVVLHEYSMLGQKFVMCLCCLQYIIKYKYKSYLFLLTSAYINLCNDYVWYLV